MKLLPHRDGDQIDIPDPGADTHTKHVFDKDSVLAVNAALAVGRPLLVRGEPGTGKSQLARAAAHALGRTYVSKVVDARTEITDLFYTFDAVRRLAEAQLCATIRSADETEMARRLDETRFLAPGPLWWAFDWQSARAQAAEARTQAPEVPNGIDPDDGVVVLLDEIDKADSSIPNGLLEALGNRRFEAPALGSIVARGQPPLVVITTNEERALPDAFLRRCLVLHLRLSDDRDELIEWLMGRGRAHFPESSDRLRRKAAELLWRDRTAFREQHLSPPGQAEYLDLLKAVIELRETDDQQFVLLDHVAGFVLRKHPDAPSD